MISSAIRAFVRRASTLSSASVDLPRRMLRVQWKGQEERIGQFPITWLRDNCQCGKCFEPLSKARCFNLKNLDTNIVPEDVKVHSSENRLRVLWPDEHVSDFESDWLISRDFGRHGHQFNAEDESEILQIRLWGQEMKDNVLIFDFNKIMTDDATLLTWIKEIEERGFACIKNAPTEENTLVILGRRIGNLRTTNYGLFSRIETKENPSNVSFTSRELDIHTDLCYFNYVPGVLFLHYVTQPKMKGGENRFVDGWKAAEDLRKRNKDAFNLLASTTMEFYDIGTDHYQFHMRSRHPTIKLDKDGRIERFVYSNHGRDSLISLPADLVQPHYEALSELTDCLNSSTNVIEIKPASGDIVSLNNWRVLHGRNSFTLDHQQSRLLTNAYVDWDEMKSCKRVVSQRLKNG